MLSCAGRINTSDDKEGDMKSIKKIKKVLPKRVGIEVEGPPLKGRGWAEWEREARVVRIMERKRMPGHVREAERDNEPAGIWAAEKGR